MEGTRDADLLTLATRAKCHGRTVGYARKCAARVEAHRRGLYRAPTAQESVTAREYRPAREARYHAHCECLAPRAVFLAPGHVGPVPGGGHAGCTVCGRIATARAVLLSTGLGPLAGRT